MENSLRCGAGDIANCRLRHDEVVCGTATGHDSGGEKTKLGLSVGVDKFQWG